MRLSVCTSAQKQAEKTHSKEAHVVAASGKLCSSVAVSCWQRFQSACMRFIYCVCPKPPVSPVGFSQQKDLKTLSCPGIKPSSWPRVWRSRIYRYGRARPAPLLYWQKHRPTSLQWRLTWHHFFPNVSLSWATWICDVPVSKLCARQAVWGLPGFLSYLSFRQWFSLFGKARTAHFLPSQTSETISISFQLSLWVITWVVNKQGGAHSHSSFPASVQVVSTFTSVKKGEVPLFLCLQFIQLHDHPQAHISALRFIPRAMPASLSRRW